MLGRSLKMAFWIFHDHLGALLIVNFIWAAAVAIPIGFAVPAFLSGDVRLVAVIGLPLLTAAVFICAPVFGAGIAHLIKVLIDDKDGGVGDFFRGIRLYGVRAAVTGLCYAVATVLLGTSAWFYPMKLQTSMPVLGYALGAFAVWCLCLIGMTTLFVLPALVQRRTGIIATLRLATLLVLSNPGLSLGLALQCAMLTVVVAVVLPLFFAGYGAAIFCIGSAAYELLARKYAPKKDAVPPDDEHDDYLNRGLKDLFFPWKT